MACWPRGRCGVEVPEPDEGETALGGLRSEVEVSVGVAKCVGGGFAAGMLAASSFRSLISLPSFASVLIPAASAASSSSSICFAVMSIVLVRSFMSESSPMRSKKASPPKIMPKNSAGSSNPPPGTASPLPNLSYFFRNSSLLRTW